MLRLRGVPSADRGYGVLARERGPRMDRAHDLDWNAYGDIHILTGSEMVRHVRGTLDVDQFLTLEVEGSKTPRNVPTVRRMQFHGKTGSSLRQMVYPWFQYCIDASSFKRLMSIECEARL